MNWFARKPFRALMLSMMAVAILPLLLNNLYYFQFRNTVIRQQEALTEQSLSASVQQIDSTFLTLTTSGLTLADEMQRVSIPSAEEMTVTDRIDLWQVRTRLEEEISLGSEYISTIYIYSNETDRAVDTTGIFSAEELYARRYKSIGVSREEIEPLHKKYYNSKLVVLGDNNLAFVRSIGRDKDGQPKKQMVFLLRDSFYTTLIVNNNVESGIFVLVNNKGKALAVSNKTSKELSNDVISSICESESGDTFELFGDSAKIFSLKSTVGGYYVKAVVPYSQLLESFTEFYKYYWVLLAAAMVLGLVLSIFFSRRNTMPINRLIDYIQNNYGSGVENTQGLEKIKTAVDSLLSQRRMDREQLERYETDISRFCLRDSLQGITAESGGFEIPPNASYVVVCLTTQQPCTENDNAWISESQKVFSEDCFCHSLVLDGVIVEVLGSYKEGFDEKTAEELLTAQISWLDQENAPAFTAAYSTVHSGSDSLERAYGEAGIAINFADKDAVLASFSNCEFRSSDLLRDWHHLDKQLMFSHCLGSENLKEALEVLPSLFPAEFLDEYFMGSDISKLHLSSLKYQFLHDLDVISKSDNAWTEITQEMLHCRSHRKLYQLMKEQIEGLISDSDTKDVPQEMSEDSRISEVKRYIKQNYNDPQLSVASVAENFGLSANTLSQLFRRKSDVGLLDYIHKVRMKRAGQLLRDEPQLTVAEIAENTGYVSALTFTRKFKAQYEMTPAEYRKANLHKNEH